MIERLLIAGSGGQGIIFIGRLLANLGMKRFPHLTFIPSYGAEVRGGTSHCELVFSTAEIASPVSECFSSAIIMNEPSAQKFLRRVKDGGLAVLNSSMCVVPRRSRVVGVDATRRSDALGDARSANLVMLGSYLARTKLLPADAVEAAISTIFAQKRSALTDINIKAFRLGLAL